MLLGMQNMTLTATYFDPLSNQLIATFDDTAPLLLGQVVDPHLRELFILDPGQIYRAALEQPGTIEGIAEHCGLPPVEVEAMVRRLVEEMELEEEAEPTVFSEQLPAGQAWP